MNSAIHVFKFGGASVKDANAVLNVVELIKKHDRFKLVVVVSAMGKTTNKLEHIFNSFIKKDKREHVSNITRWFDEPTVVAFFIVIIIYINYKHNNAK